MAQKSFAHGGTEKKLQTLADYLSFYTRALNGKFELTYFDAFAGTGEIPIAENLPLLKDAAEYEKIVEGSARRALNITPSFDHFVFVEGKQKNVSDLAKLKTEFPAQADKITILHEDANVAIQRYCRDQFLRNDRAVMFLDPFGNQVKWETIAAIAETPGIDLWYLFPAGMGVARQISQDGRVQKDAGRSISEMLGTANWREKLTVTLEEPDLFDTNRELKRKIATADAVTRLMISRMKPIFAGGVLEEWLPLGKRGGHWYSLIFAWTNPSPAASNLASRVAKDIMRKK